MRRSRPALMLAALLAALQAAGAAALQEPQERSETPPEGAAGELRGVDRIVAVVDEDPVFESEIDRTLALGLVEPQEGEGPAALRRRILEQLIDQRLRFQEMGRFGERTVTVEEIEAAVDEMSERFGDPEAFDQHLRESGTTRAELRQIVARQLAVVDYVDRRLGSRVFIGLEDIQSFYNDELVPEMHRQGAPIPPLDEVRETIRQVLRERRLNEEIERWTDDLRRQADVQILIDDYPAELPPVRMRIGRPVDGGQAPDGS